MNNLPALFTRRNLEILLLISEHPRSLREIAEMLKCSPAKVHQAVAIFKKAGIVTTERKKNQLIIAPNRASQLYQRIKSLVNVARLLSAPTYSALKKIGIIGVYGSFAQGTDDATSDIDLLIVTEKKEIDIRQEIRSLENELGKRVNPFIVTKQKLYKLENENYEFYIRLKLTTLALNGDQFG